MNGITRQNLLSLCRREGIPCRELDFSLTQVPRLAWLRLVWYGFVAPCVGALHRAAA